MMSTWAVKSAKSIDSSCRKGKGFNSVLALLPSPRKLGKSNQKGEESPYDRVRGLSSPRAWEVALVPFPENFAPLPPKLKRAWHAKQAGNFHLASKSWSQDLCGFVWLPLQRLGTRSLLTT